MVTMTNRELITEVRTRSMSLDFGIRWLILDLCNRFEKQLCCSFMEDLSDGALD